VVDPEDDEEDHKGALGTTRIGSWAIEVRSRVGEGREGLPRQVVLGFFFSKIEKLRRVVGTPHIMSSPGYENSARHETSKLEGQ
jgi:hypothetical protein